MSDHTPHHKIGEIREQDEYDYLPVLRYHEQIIADRMSSTPYAVISLHQVIRTMVTNLLSDWGLCVAEENIDISITANDAMEFMSFDPNTVGQPINFRDLKDHIFNSLHIVEADKDGRGITFSGRNAQMYGTFSLTVQQPPTPKPVGADGPTGG